MKIAIRMDDITADMDWERFLALEALFDQYHIAPLLGLVPACQDPMLHMQEARPDFYEYMRRLRDEKGWVLCQHGYCHLYTTKRGGLFPLNRFSEYAGVSPEKQKQMISDGKAILEKEGIHPTLFMAPGHTFDRNTLKILAECGFTGLTDGFGAKPYRRDGLTFYPISKKKSAVFDGGEGYTTLVIHANTMNDGEYQWYERMLKEHREDFISYGEYLQAEAVNRSLWGNLGEYLTASMKRMLVSLLVLAKRIKA